MKVLSLFGSGKHQRVINSVTSYFDEESSTIPFTAKQIQNTIHFLNKNDTQENRLLVEKLTMASKIAAAQKLKA